jgi:uncharacterized protein involved in exopolysaccharide biosynthesis
MATRTAPDETETDAPAPWRGGGRREPPLYDRHELDTLMGMVRVLSRSRRLLMIGPLVLAVAIAIISFIVDQRWTSKAAITPENKNSQGLASSASGLLGLASSFGVSLGGAATVGPQFYAEVLRSREIEVKLLGERFALTPTAHDSAPLIDLLKIKNKNPERRLYSALRSFDGRLTTDVDARTSIVHVSFDAPTPSLARDVLDSLLSELNRFNLVSRQSTARARRQFLEGQTKAGDSALRADEEELKDFFIRNRQYMTSPDLQFVEQRLQRKMSMQEELVTTLRSNLETARMDEVNDAPVITVIDHPFVPAYRSSPHRTVWVLVALVTGFCLTATFILVRYSILARLHESEAT